MVKIQTITADVSGLSTIDFTNIPQTFTDLKLVASLRVSRPSTDIDGILIRFNNDNTGGNYSGRRLYGTGSSATSDSNTTGNFFATAASSTASVFASNEMYLPNYTSSNYKSVSGDSVEENNATAASQDLNAGLWSSSAVINRVTFTAPGNFAQYSTATLYGIKSS